MSNTSYTVLDKVVNINKDYEAPTEEEDRKIDNGKFVKYGWLDVDKFDFVEDNDTNVGIRADQGENRSSIEFDDFTNKVNESGWKICYIPPIFDIKTNRPRDGRKRMAMARELGVKKLPIMYRSYDSKVGEETSRITSGLKNNLRHDIADETTVEDVVEGLGVLIKSKELAHDEDSIRIYLWEELEIKSHFCTRTINRIIERALALGSDGIELVKRLERPDAIAWLNTKAKIKYTGEIDYDAKVERILFTPSDLSAYRVLCKHIIPNVKNGIKTEIILYTTKFDPDGATKFMKEFPPLLRDELIGALSYMVDKVLSPNFSMRHPFVCKEWCILGAIPQKLNVPDHVYRYKNGMLIDVEDF
jgi:hypothetical protein